MTTLKSGRILITAIMLMALQSCRLQTDELAILDENAENVKLVLYYSDGDFDWKRVGEWILIESGELLQVHRNQIRPDPRLIIHEWNDELLEKVESPPLIGKVPLRLDRKNGIACNEKNCTIIYAICPPRSEMKYGKKCVSFTHR